MCRIVFVMVEFRFKLNSWPRQNLKRDKMVIEHTDNRISPILSHQAMLAHTVKTKNLYYLGLLKRLILLFIQLLRYHAFHWIMAHDEMSNNQ